MKEMTIVIVTACLTNNVVLVKFLGVCPFLGVSGKLGKAMSMSLAVTITMVVSAVVTWPLTHFILKPYKLEYLQTAAFLFIIGAVVQFLEALSKKFLPERTEGLGAYLPLIATNCAILGICELNISKDYSFLTTLFNAFGSGLGFALAMFMFSGIRERIEHNDILESFKGLPITLIAAGIASLSIVGFTGLVVGLFGM